MAKHGDKKEGDGHLLPVTCYLLLEKEHLLPKEGDGQ